jgi:hypothetical protein
LKPKGDKHVQEHFTANGWFKSIAGRNSKRDGGQSVRGANIAML